MSKDNMISYMFSEEQKLSNQRSKIPNTSTSSTSKTASSPESTPSPQSPHSPGFRQNPISPDIFNNSSIFGLSPEVIAQRFQQSSASSVSTPSSLISSNNPLVPSPSPKTPESPPLAGPSLKMPYLPTSINALPVPGSKLAPSKVTGKYNMGKLFTDHYTKLIQGITHMTDEQKCKSMMQYCSTKVSTFLEQINSYRTNNFSQLIKDIHDYYDVQLSESRWKERDLIKFVKQNSQSMESIQSPLSQNCKLAIEQQSN